MNWWLWLLAWLGLSIVLAPIVGMWLKRAARHYPTPEEYEIIKRLAEEEARNRND